MRPVDLVVNAMLAGARTRTAICTHTGLSDHTVHGVLVGLALAGRAVLYARAWSLSPGWSAACP